MGITSTTAVRVENVTTITVVSDLAGSGTVYYHWYQDGAWLGRTTSPTRSIYLDAEAQARIEVIDTVDPDFDGAAAAPAGYPAVRTLWWTASLATDIDHYRVEQQEGAGGDWESIGVVHHVAGQWTYRQLSPRLTDLTEYTWRIVPVDRAGNDGTPTTIGPELVVRTPDAPDFDATFDPETLCVSFEL